MRRTQARHGNTPPWTSWPFSSARSANCPGDAALARTGSRRVRTSAMSGQMRWAALTSVGSTLTPCARSGRSSATPSPWASRRCNEWTASLFTRGRRRCSSPPEGSSRRPESGHGIIGSRCTRCPRCGGFVDSHESRLSPQRRHRARSKAPRLSRHPSLFRTVRHGSYGRRSRVVRCFVSGVVAHPAHRFEPY
jgi:hypothetical protein